MNSIETFLSKHWSKVALFLLVVITFNTCGNPNKTTNKRIDALTSKVDSLQSVVATKKDLQVEGLKAEKRMIQSTDRKILDVQRQSVIDNEIKAFGY
jgi:hypothetical protein